MQKFQETKFPDTKFPPFTQYYPGKYKETLLSNFREQMRTREFAQKFEPRLVVWVAFTRIVAPTQIIAPPLSRGLNYKCEKCYI